VPSRAFLTIFDELLRNTSDPCAQEVALTPGARFVHELMCMELGVTAVIASVAVLGVVADRRLVLV